jgi:hypothetical protein
VVRPRFVQAQLVTKHGVPCVVVVDVETVERLTAPGRSLVDALRAAPRFDWGERAGESAVRQLQPAAAESYRRGEGTTVHDSWMVRTESRRRTHVAHRQANPGEPALLSSATQGGVPKCHTKCYALPAVPPP